MDKRLKLTIFAFFAFLFIFIVIIIISEYKNMNQLRLDYPALSEDVYRMRKDGLTLWAIRLILQFLIPILFLTSGLSYKIRFFVENERSLFTIGLLYGVIFFTLMFLINLPLNYYGSFILRHKYGLSNQTFSRWIELSLKGLLVNKLSLSLFIFIPFYIIARSPKTWWIQLSLMAIPLIIFMIFITPMYIDPIFNKYNPLEDKELGGQIEKVLYKAGISDANIYLVDKSKDTKTMNAYMTGIFQSKRIVFWDNTINNLEEGEVLSIAAHEIGHYVERHIWKSIVLGSFGTIILMFLVYITSNWILDLSRGSFGIKNLSDIAALPLLLLVLNFYSFLSLPITNYVSRYMEREADTYEIILTGDRESAVSAMEKLYKESLGVPRPSNIYKIWYHSHPSLEERVDFYKNHPMD